MYATLGVKLEGVDTLWKCWTCLTFTAYSDDAVFVTYPEYGDVVDDPETN